ncbi:MAG TPA: NUDIX domain-containing protein [Flavilitoribacter sp.]|nr:NUDIX domain-containing protein [Flavilitoribacter sp.]HMQ89578.1 NUDIX domain-containing protein [Flavilitoribacter sp.]
MAPYLQTLRKLVGNRKLIHPAARIIIENDAGEILLIRRRDNGRWGLIAGGLEEGEDITTCIIREVWEETGLNMREPEGIGLSTRPEVESVEYPNGDQVQYFTVVFYANRWTGELRMETDETREARFFSKDQMPELPPNEAPSLVWLEEYKRTGRFIIG